jgi:hypothetical protein
MRGDRGAITRQCWSRNRRKNDRVATLGSLLTNIVIAVALLALVGLVGVYFYRLAHPEKFAPRQPRLSYVERTALDGGRKLLLVRRDDVEHLILIGGPIDLVVETGIRAEDTAAKMDLRAANQTIGAAKGNSWFSREAVRHGTKAASEPQLSLSPQPAAGAADKRELALSKEAKATE